jgi:HAD superfamily hydrolase (TIGR01490 family)
MKLMPNDRAKQRVLKYFFGGMKAYDFQAACDDFASTRLPQLIRPRALQEMKKLKAGNVEIVIVSASAGNWIRKWSDSLSLELISTSLEIKDGLLTGKIAGNNCYGEEKVRRIRASYDLSRYETIYAYGDTPGDRPMLTLAGHAFYKPFR